MAPVVLITPRWSRSYRFLDDVKVDLAIGRPRIACQTLSLEPLQGHTVHESWTWLVRAMSEFCELGIQGPVSQAVSRNGFRHVMSGLFDASTEGPRRALLIHGLEHLHVEARDDLIRVFEEHVRRAQSARRLNLLLAGTVDAPSFAVRGASRLVLPDFAPQEAVEALVEHTGLVQRGQLDKVVKVVGGVPALVDAVGLAAENGEGLVMSREALLRALGPLADEVRGAVAIVSSVEGLADRLDEVASSGPLPVDAEWDGMLERAGLVQSTGARRPGHVALRAPLFAELAG